MNECIVCKSTDFHAPNSYICKLISSPCKHEWGEKTIETGDECKSCNYKYTVSKCKKCDMKGVLHWSEVFPHDNGECELV